MLFNKAGKQLQPSRWLCKEEGAIPFSAIKLLDNL